MIRIRADTLFLFLIRFLRFNEVSEKYSRLFSEELRAVFQGSFEMFRLSLGES